MLPTKFPTNVLTVEVDIQDERWTKVLNDYQDLTHKICLIVLEEAQFSVLSINDAEISVVLTDDAEITKLNKKYKNKNKPTNVLSFPLEFQDVDDYSFMHHNIENIMLGDVVFAFETMVKEAEEQNKTIYDHFCHLMTHGCLHLIGYDHENDEDADLMEKLEVRILAKLNIKSPYE